MVTFADATLAGPDAFDAHMPSENWRITTVDGRSRGFDDDNARRGWGPYATRGGDDG